MNPFNEIINRRNTQSIKWDVEENELPMWVADMDFKTAPAVQKAIMDRAASGVYGYTAPFDDWFEAYLSFYKDRHDLTLKKEWLMFSTGVVPTISSSVRAFTDEGDEVLLLTPVYNIFFNSILNNHRIAKEVPLIRDGDAYQIDFKTLEEAASSPKAKLLIFCNPGNPISRIWTKDEIAQVGKICVKHGLIILSDEIHGELTRPGTSYIPFLKACPEAASNLLMAVSPTKSFNLAGIQSSAIIAPSEAVYKKINRQINADEVAEPNVFSCVAAVAALNEGREWLDELRKYLFVNRDFVSEYLASNVPMVRLLPGDATYLLWIDVSKVSEDDALLADFIRKETGLFLSKGSVYGEGGKGFLRMNVACPRQTLIDGLLRFKEGIARFLAQK